MSANRLAEFLASHADDLAAFVARHGRSLLRYESEEDLAQGVRTCALDRGGDFEYRSEKEALGWLFTVARRYLSDRRSYWAAVKRRPRRLLRLTAFGSTAGGDAAAAEPADTATGPSTSASRREDVAMALRALAILLPRDRDLVTWYSEGVAIDDVAARLAISRDAASRAQLRALERFRKAFAVLARGR